MTVPRRFLNIYRTSRKGEAMHKNARANSILISQKISQNGPQNGMVNHQISECSPGFFGRITSLASMVVTKTGTKLEPFLLMLSLYTKGRI